MRARSLCLLAAGGLLSAGSALAACQVAGAGTAAPDPSAAASCGSFSEVHNLGNADVLLGQAAVMAKLGAHKLAAADTPLLGRYPQAEAPEAAAGAFADQPTKTIAQVVAPVPEPEGVLAALAGLATLGVLLRRRQRRAGSASAASAA